MIVWEMTMIQEKTATAPLLERAVWAVGERLLRYSVRRTAVVLPGAFMRRASAVPRPARTDLKAILSLSCLNRCSWEQEQGCPSRLPVIAPGERLSCCDEVWMDVIRRCRNLHRHLQSQPAHRKPFHSSRFERLEDLLYKHCESPTHVAGLFKVPLFVLDSLYSRVRYYNTSGLLPDYITYDVIALDELLVKILKSIAGGPLSKWSRGCRSCSRLTHLEPGVAIRLPLPEYLSDNYSPLSLICAPCITAVEMMDWGE
jgi:hypothetical protein